MEKIALFDFDGTLIVKDSFLEFAKFAVGKWGVAKGALKSLPWLVGWKLRLVKSSKAKERLFGNIFRGMEYGEFVRLGNLFAEKIDGMTNCEVKDRFDSMLTEGVRCIVVTASLKEWVEPWARRHGVKRVVATEPMVGPDGCLTGLFATLNCRGKEKVVRLREEIPGIDRMEIHAWGNMPDDKEMLAMARYPYVI